MSKNVILKNIASLGALQIANYVFPLISIPVISRIIGPDKFGVINYAAAFIAYFNLLISYGFDFTATRRIAKDPNNIVERNIVFSEVFYAKIILFFVSCLLFIGCLYLVPPLALEKKVTIFSFLICISMVGNQTWLFQAMQDLPKVAILTFISRLLFTFTVLFIVRSKQDYFWQPLITSIIQILAAAASFYWAIKKYNLKLLTVPFKQMSNLLWNEKTIFFSMVVINLYTTTNVVILGILKNETQVGYYSAAQKLIDVASNVINVPLAQTLFPLIGFAFGESTDKGLIMIQKILPLVVLFTGLFAILLFFLGPTILLWFYGKGFAHSVPVFKILVFVPLIISVNNIFCIQVMLNLKMDKLFFLVTVGGAILGVGLNLLMVRYFGYIGTAWNWIVVETYITLAAYLVLRTKGINPIDINQFRIKNIGLQLQPIVAKLKYKLK